MSSVTDRPAPTRRPALALAALSLAALALAACGSQKSTLPPAPSAKGTISLRHLAHDPEVYSDATVATIGTVRRVARPHHGTLYALAGGGGARIVLEPAHAVARYAGRRVRVSGLFAVSFQIGYEILVSRITPIGTL